MVVVFVYSNNSKIEYVVHHEHIGTSTLKGEFYYSTPGVPQLPYNVYPLLLPPNCDFESVKINVIFSNVKKLVGDYTIHPAPEHWENGEKVQFSSRDIVNGKDVEIYRSNQYFPLNDGVEYEKAALRDFKYVRVKIAPYLYNPVTKEIIHRKNGRITVEYKEKNMPRPSYKIPYFVKERLQGYIKNYTEGMGFYNGFTFLKKDQSSYVIITTDAIKNGLQKLDRFIESKTVRGFTVKVITEETWGGGTGSSAADNIRRWLQQNYKKENIGYVLLLGNPDPRVGDIPMKTAYAYFGNKDAPTDFYFGELTGNWDADGDGKVGEVDDVKASGGIDRDADVAIGRIPVYGGNFGVVDHILQKTIDYENTLASNAQWRKNMLLIMDGYYGNEGPQVGEKIRSSLSGGEWNFYRIYKGNIGSPDQSSVSMSKVSQAWNNNPYGVVEWLTHGKEDAAMHIMDNNHAKQLNDKYPSVVFMGSCLNAKPEVSNNLAYTLLQNGAINTFGGTRTTIYIQPIGNFEKSSYNYGFIYNFGKTVGVDKGYAIHAFDKVRRVSDLGCWKNYCCYNLYGCPAVGISTTGNGVTINESKVFLSTAPKISVRNHTLSIQHHSLETIRVFTINGREISLPIRKKTVSNIYRFTLPKEIATNMLIVSITMKGGVKYSSTLLHQK